MTKLKIFFDDHDYRLLDIVNAVLDHKESFSHLNELLFPNLHPNGIKELAESRGLRIAYAIIHLLSSLDSAKADERLRALRSLKDEVQNSADSHMRRNTARVLLQIMKEIIRARGDRLGQLKLAHDFRSAISGKPRIIRRLLRENHLIEMPEEWNQIAFDGHVHDFSTKGRKSPSHLMMDAWIKGIRFLTIIHYNYVDPEPVAELLEAADIMDITVRIGVEFAVRFYDKFVQLVWLPRGFSDAQDFLSFLRRPAVRELMEQGRNISQFLQRRVLDLLEEFNEKHRPAVAEEFGIKVPPLDRFDFLSSLRTGQASILHLARFIHAKLLPVMRRRVESLRETYAGAGQSERSNIRALIHDMNSFDTETILERCLKSPCNRHGSFPRPGCPDLPNLLRLSPAELISRLNQLNSGYAITLNLAGLKWEDVLEFLYDCRGAITHLEIFNFKDHMSGNAPDYDKINQLQQVINSKDILKLMRMTRKMRDNMKANPHVFSMERIEKYETILKNSKQLLGFYEHTPLGSILGSDSTGHSHRTYGMGFVIRETLPARIRRKIEKRRKVSHPTIPVEVDARLVTTSIPRAGFLGKVLRFFLGPSALSRKIRKWHAADHLAKLSKSGNVVALGGIRKESNGLFLEQPAQRTRPEPSCTWRYLNGILKNGIKILAGFIPSVVTFMYTQDWWFLVYFGTPIWFLITGLRNVLQSVFGGGGIHRSPLLRWNNYVSWDRMSDSLLYTGLSVPLLEYLIRVLLLEQTLDITTTTNPVILYSVMSVVNGAYISGHNIIRGLPKEAVYGNLFRSILNIPLSIGFNLAIGSSLTALGVVAVNDILQKWASIISKTSSDCVAALIEGVADRRNYIRIRIHDFRAKIAGMMSTHEKLEIAFPKCDVLSMLEKNEFINHYTDDGVSDLYKIQIINAVDLLYFWMYQPRGRITCISLMKKMNCDEMKIFILSQAVLRHVNEVANLFINGLVGDNWSKALVFYLNTYPSYLDSLDGTYERLCVSSPNSFKQTVLAISGALRHSAVQPGTTRQI